ncbi:helix-turn-helix domain-containing protein [Aneurinibacillus thermoaerophilus]|uniref:helix-turn-helix domain-containing protein n=1 Tax=Aneurinibacillus thermoaerophilus TaxID=143495 RepID=UPI002E231645|nr:helix-turn-helix domain-containing protein [Aneurinibacillus thermoaerophilus]MED0738916.1 helix-turn-helix domain-containing protein [Aneurinibacillus thermoaerophilus]MED0766217.1 helix-turn-helix domain-containing protein [Aneurinibacillus thermoaerophilus]
MIDDIIKLYIQQQVQEEVKKALSEHSAGQAEKRNNNYPPYLTVPEVASIMRLGKNKVYDLAHDPTFPAFKEGRKIRIPTNAFFNWLESRHESELKAKGETV